MIPDDAHYCPSCGDPLQDRDVSIFSDEILNRYRVPFRCRECGYRGEVIRHSASNNQPDAPDEGRGHIPTEDQ